MHPQGKAEPMVTNLQFAAVAAYLLWCLFTALTTGFEHTDDDAASVIDESDKNAPVG
jgi:hypothetical protein